MFLCTCVQTRVVPSRCRCPSSANPENHVGSRSDLRLPNILLRRPGQTPRYSNDGRRTSSFPFIGENASGEVLLILDGCVSHGDLNDPSGRVRAMYLPPNCTSVYQPMDMGVIEVTMPHYRRRLLDCTENCTKQLLRDEAKGRKMDVGTAGLE